MRLVRFDDGKVGRVEGHVVTELGVGSLRECFERGGAVDAASEQHALAAMRLRAPIVPKKFFHTAGNFREPHEESQRVGTGDVVSTGTVSGAAGFSQDAAALPEAGRRDRGGDRTDRVLRNPVVSWQDAHGEPTPPRVQW